MDVSSLRASLAKERLEKNVLLRIKWDPSMEKEHFSIKYIDRIENSLKELRFPDIELEGDFFRAKTSLIPMHRIRQILYKGEIVWQRK